MIMSPSDYLEKMSLLVKLLIPLYSVSLISLFPAHSVTDETKEAILKIFSRPELSGSNFLHFKDILLADFGIQISYSAL